MAAPTPSVGDVHNSRGSSLYVRLVGPTTGRGAAGHWTDAATGEHRDLLDLLQAHLGLSTLSETLDEARRFLSLPRPEPGQRDAAPRNSPLAARRLFAMGDPVPGTTAERYLRARGITAALDLDALRYHPRVFCRELGPDRALPALLAAVTDLSGRITAVQRTWLDPLRPAKARLRDPRRSLGDQLGNGVRLGRSGAVDYAAGMTYWQRQRQDKPRDLDGVALTLARDGAGYAVTAVADRYGERLVKGIESGDRLLAVDDIPLWGEPPDHALAKLGGKPGDRRRLELLHAGERKSVDAIVSGF